MMQSFEWIDARSVEQAARLLSAARDEKPVVAMAGGMDLIDLMKEGIVAPARVVNLKTIDGLDSLQHDDTAGLRIGALITLATMAKDPLLRQRYGALTAAASHAATPQVRNAATIGGNLLQRPRCWYFRNHDFHAPGIAVDARSGENQYHAIFDNALTAMVHASTPATALIAYGASVQLVAEQGRSRTVHLENFLLPPDMARDRDAAIERGEVLTQVTIPPLAPGTRAAYHKQTERDSYDWPICDVAVVLRLDARTVRSASIVLGWVAPTPRRAVEAEQILLGREIDEAIAARAARAAIGAATPLAKNAYKVTVLEAVIRSTIVAASLEEALSHA